MPNPLETMPPESNQGAIQGGTRQAVPSVSQPHIAAVDGLRAAACLAVVSFHCFYYGGRSEWPRFALGQHEFLPSHFLLYGHLGVELFFVLSGFCLAYPFFRHPDRPYDWKRYFINRARRIYPPYWGALLLLSALAVVISHTHIPALVESRALQLPPVRRLCLSFINPETDMNGSFWTLKVELRWYLLLPLLLLLHRRTKSLGLMGVAVLVSVIYALAAKPGTQATNLISTLPLYLPLFVAGIWIAEMVAVGRPTRLELVLIRYARWGAVFSCVLIWLVTPPMPASDIRYDRVVPGGLLASFLLLLTLYDPALRRVLSWRPLVSIGLFSYSLYLIHQPMVEIAYAIVGPRGWPAYAEILFFQGAVPTGCVALGYLFYRVAEKPFLRRSPQRDPAGETSPARKV